MENNSESDSASGAGASKKPIVTIFAVLALSLATWYFFQLESMPLTALDTTLVVGVWLVLVLIAKAIWGRFRRRSKAG